MAAPAAGSDRAQGCVKIKSYNRIIGPNISRPRIYGRGSTARISAIKRFTIHTPIQRKHLPENFGKRENLAMGTLGIELDKDQGWVSSKWRMLFLQNFKDNKNVGS